MLYARHDSYMLGSDYTVMAPDLETVRGVCNRIVRGKWPAGHWRIYDCHPADWYKVTGHFLVGKCHKRKARDNVS
jgi:hypothetical protein